MRFLSIGACLCYLSAPYTFVGLVWFKIIKELLHLPIYTSDL